MTRIAIDCTSQLIKKRYNLTFLIDLIYFSTLIIIIINITARSFQLSNTILKKKNYV